MMMSMSRDTSILVGGMERFQTELQHASLRPNISYVPISY